MHFSQRPLHIPGYTGQGDWLPVEAPFDRQEVGRVEQAPPEALEQALHLAAGKGSERMRRMPAGERAAILNRAAAKVREQANRLALGVALEGGKPLRDAKVEVLRAANTLELSAEAALTAHGEQLPMDRTAAAAQRFAVVSREPIGLVLAISAFNHPVNLIAHQVGPALAAGNAVLVKPASSTPFSCYAVVDLLREADLPEEACLVTPCPGRKAEQLVSDPRVRFITFIGSAAQGWQLRRVAADGTRLSLEHGGTAPVVVHADADLDRAVPMLVKGAYYHAGQVCISTQRIFVHASRQAELEARFVAETARLKVGDPTLEETDVGPIITAAELARVSSQVEEAKGLGARVLLGGSPRSATCYAPTVLADVQDGWRVMAEEVFGPVACITPYEDLEEAIRRINANDQPFQAAVFTRDLDVAFHVGREVRANCCVVNDHSAFRVDWMPFGGQGKTGLGMGGPRYAVEEMTVGKLLVFNLQTPKG